MGIMQHNFLGAMDLDSKMNEIPPGFNMGTRNGIWRGVPGRMRLESVPGTTGRFNPFYPSTGTNKCIFTGYDAVNQRIFDFNYNSTGKHAIYIYYTQTGQWVRLIEDGVNTEGDPLAFTPYRINSVDIIYADNNNGDLLFFVDSLKRPRKLNIDRLLNNGYTVVKDNFLKVIKAPPIIPPKVVYENDFTATVNDCVNSLFKFCYSLIYDDFEESVFSSGCAMALPSDPFNPINNIPQSRNCRIRVYLQTGDQNVVKIRIYAKQVKDGVTSDWFVVDTLIKADLNIQDNSVYQYLFYNNGSYVPSDPKLAILLQDYVPLEANCECLLDGNVVAYSGIKEGYDYVNPNFNITTQNIASPQYSINGVLLCGYLNGLFTGAQAQVTFYLTGVGTNDGFGNPTDLEKGPTFLTVRARSSNISIGFTYNNGAGNRNIATLLFNLRGQAASAGWVYVSNTTNSLTMYYPTGNIQLGYVGANGVSSDVSPYKSPRLAFYPESNYQFEVTYYDADGRTYGASSNVTGVAKMPAYNPTIDQIPMVTIDLSSFKPPIWAAYYHLGRTDTGTYAKHTYWATNQAFSNTDQSTGTLLAYLGITNIQEYNENINATEGVVSYNFSPGDRVRILGRYTVNGVFTQLSFDYSVLGVVTDPLLNGIVQKGDFVKIYYPTGDIGANFKFDGTDDFQNYQILLYSYIPYSPTNQNVFYEVGQQYGFAINNLGKYHLGNAGDNLINITDGDIFYRERVVPVGNTYYIQVPQNGFSNQYVTKATANDQGVISNASYEINQQIPASAGLTSATYPTYPNTNQLYWNKTGSTSQIRVRGEYNVNGDKPLTTRLLMKVVEPSGNITIVWIIRTFSIAQQSVVASYTIPFDAYVTIPAGAKAWMIWANESSSGVSNIYIAAFTLRLDVIRNATLQIFEPSFSDIYSLVTNSDSRPVVVDVTAKQTYYSTFFRYSLDYQIGTTINNTNRFYPQNQDEFDKSHGDVMRMIPRQREVDVFQKRKCGHFGVYGKFLKNNQGDIQLIATDVIITPNNIQYYIGDFGVGNQPDAISISGYQRFFCDPVKGFICRLSLNGVEPISEIYKVQTWAGNNLTNYLQNYNFAQGGTPVILGVFNFTKDRDSEAIFVLQAGTTAAETFDGPGSTTITQPAITGGTGSANIIGESIAFNDRKNAFTSFYDFSPDAIVCAENVLYSFHAGQLYSHDNVGSDSYCNFYGTQSIPSIILPYNDAPSERKTFTAINQTSNVPWNAPLIYTDSQTYGDQRQESKLIDQNFTNIEGNYYTSFYRDIHSPKGWVNGDFLKGNLIIVQLQVTDGGKFSYLSSCNVNFLESPLNKR